MKKEIFPITLILILALFRLIPHPPNFTPIIAVAILSGYFFKNLYFSFLVLIVSMIIADFFIGFYDNMFVVYLSLMLISFTFYRIGSKLNYKNLFLFSLFGSLIFFVITNFGVWALGNLYEKNLKGLIYCYIAAIPFFKNTLFSTIIFSYGAFLTNYFVNKKLT
mgnify:CR=1 FL=1|tara:strand:+ start:31 stop:522 length:492 start_codon:yes stop_codon:yes gene_type:complete